MSLLEKRCSKCGELKSLEEFYKDKKRKDGYYPQCKKCKREYHELNREKIKKRRAEHYKENRTKILEKNSQYYQENREERLLCISIYGAKYHKENKEKCLAKSTKNHIRRYQGGLRYYSKEFDKLILEFYKESERLSNSTGVKHNVDHIVPLKGKDVSGLHVPWNLQVITAKENMSKGNTLDEPLCA